MSEEQVTAPAEGQPEDEAVQLVKTVENIATAVDGITKKQEDFEKKLEEATKVDYGGRGAPFAVRKGEDPMSSRGWSLMRMAVGLRKRMRQEIGWRDFAKVEFDLSDRLRKAYEAGMGHSTGHDLMPLGADLMPTEAREVIDAESGRTMTMPGLPAELVKECREIVPAGVTAFDPAELSYLDKAGLHQIRKDLSANTATTGGTLVGFASQGELIEFLRGMEVFSRAGAQEIDLPPQGSIRFPRQTSGITIAAYAEAATISESTPGTSHLLLQAKKYSGLVDIPEELMRFATSVAVEAWLRGEFARDLAVKTDQDMINGAGGTAIQGVINFSGVRTVTASTTAANGDTLEAQDPQRLYADIADQNAPVDAGFFYAMRNVLWAGMRTRRADAVSAADAAGPFVFQTTMQMAGGGGITQQLDGHPVLTSTHVPNNRSKGASSNLTLLLGGVGREWLIARAGVVEISMTNSDASKFQQGLSTMRGTMFIDAGPRHENSFGYIDDVTNS